MSQINEAIFFLFREMNPSSSTIILGLLCYTWFRVFIIFDEFIFFDWLSIYKWGIIELILSDFDWFICSKKIPSYLSLLIYPINFVSKVVGWLQSKFLKLIMSSAFLLEISNNFAKSSIFLRKFLSRSGLIKEARTLQSICVCCSVYLDQNEIKLARI